MLRPHGAGENRGSGVREGIPEVPGAAPESLQGPRSSAFQEFHPGQAGR